ncbi:uncharacterized protein [Parasteatoda tepidariorum]|uniref:uncharacterized protein n=1 Tax=Parasteatoda tepidariorum TaxID=114398 RepID=UPI0039BD2B30
MLFYSCVVFLNVISFSKAEDECQLNVSNDGPVTLDVPVTIYARMTCSGHSYLFEFESDTGNVDEVTGNETATASFIFTKKPGIHAVRVYAHLIHPTQHRVASADTLFNVTVYLLTDPFFNVNISGNTYLEHGQLLDLEVSCNGSGPVDYCWKLLPSSENQTNLSCSDPATSPECTIPILYYFRNSGDFQLAIYVSNLVSSMQRNVQVHIYDVSLRPQLSTVIIPVVCSVLVVVIIAVAVIIQMRRRGVGNVETADFDFMRMDEANAAVAVETSWEIMWRSLVQLRCLLFCHSHVDHRDTPHYGTILKER